MECRAFLLALLLPAVANARPSVELTRDNGGRVFARQQVAATGVQKAESRTIYLNHYGALLLPGDNDSATDTSSIVEAPTVIGGWDIDDDSWQETVDCMKEIYAPFDVTITDEDPGADVPHIEAMFGGSPTDLGLPENVAGVSPFTTDCAIIEHSIVFAFTDVMNDDPRFVCEVMAQEVAHSYGLDHEMLAEDPMTYLPYLGERTFQDEMASCGEYGDRMCGINGNVCRVQQNSVKLLTSRLGVRGGGSGTQTPTGDPSGDDDDPDLRSGVTGCNAGGTGPGGALVLLMFGLGLRRRSATRHRRHRALLQRSGSDCEGGQ
ncbi:MAG TPA: MYXO-CTERM sorting domain-containing protein [Kofleriaceae bacterium]|nr:MYXO-CTERM sorting domain-containing protein [Kofleriaceae bacterium]